MRRLRLFAFAALTASPLALAASAARGASAGPDPTGLAGPTVSTGPAGAAQTRGLDADSLYERAIARARRRAKDELLAQTDLWRDHSTWSDPWIVQSEHYAVRTIESRYVAEKTASDLEYMFAEFQKLLGTNFEPNGRFQIWIFPTLSDYNAFGQNADEHSSFYGSFYATSDPNRPVVTYYVRNGTQLGMWLTHSATHQFLESAFGTNMPTWVSEGLASYFSLFWNWSWGVESLDSLVSSSNYIRLRTLLSSPLSAYTSRPDHRLIELGMFFNYLLHHHPDTRMSQPGEPESPAPFLDFLRATVRGQDASALPFWALLQEDLSLLEAEFRGHDFGG